MELKKGCDEEFTTYKILLHEHSLACMCYCFLPKLSDFFFIVNRI